MLLRWTAVAGHRDVLVNRGCRVQAATMITLSDKFAALDVRQKVVYTHVPLPTLHALKCRSVTEAALTHRIQLKLSSA